MNRNTLRPTTSDMLMCGVILLVIPFLALLFATISFAVGGGVSAWMFPVAVIATLVGAHVYMYRVGTQLFSIIRCYVYVLLAVLLALFSCLVVYDHSYDGNTYHQGAIIGMLHGWNPIYNPTQTGSPLEAHYAKSMEIIAATITMFTSRIESGKAVNIMLLFSSLFITFYFLRQEFPCHTVRRVLLLTILLTGCPVVVRQAYTYYNDFTMYIFMLLVVIALIQIKRNDKDILWWCVLVVSVLLATVTKFNIAFYLFLVLAIGVVWVFVEGNRALSYRLILVSIGLFVIGFAGLGYHPYVTNILGWGSPFYPLVGGNYDIMTMNTPEIYDGGNRFVNWVRSMFYNAEGTGMWFPLINDSLHDYYILYDARIAGFGPFFVYALILAIVAFVALVCVRKSLSRYGVGVVIISLLLILGCFIFEQSWWMRYVPFFWAVPVVLLLYTEQDIHASTCIRVMRTAVYSMLVVTILMCGCSSIVGGAAYTQRLGAIFHAVTPRSTVEIYSYGNIISFEHKLEERNIEYKRLSRGEQPSDSTLHCITFPNRANIYVDAETYSHLPHPDLMDYMISSK